MKYISLINKLRSLLLYKLKITTKYISKVGKDHPWVYISYIPDVFYFSFDKAFMHAHQNRKEMIEIVNVFNELGYNVYCSHYIQAHLPNINFKVIFGIEPGFVQACEKYPNAFKIYYATGAYGGHHNSMIRKRTKEFNMRHASKYPNQRLVPEKKFLTGVDKILQIGSKYTIETYPTDLRNKITTIHQSSTIQVKMNNQKKDYDNRQDYLWIGSSGEVLKGLDLFLDALCDKQYRLHVVGNVSQEFKEIYKNRTNIRYYGFMDVNSSAFVEICEKCNFLIYPSCTEGCPGAVINVMRLGVIPIVSQWAADDETEKYGYILKDLSIDAIHDAIEWSNSLSKDEIKKLSEGCMAYSHKMYNILQFKKEFKKYLENILLNN